MTNVFQSMYCDETMYEKSLQSIFFSSSKSKRFKNRVQERKTFTMNNLFDYAFAFTHFMEK